MSNLVYPDLSLSARFSRLLCTCAEYAQTILNDAGQASLQLVLLPTLSRISSFRTRSLLVWPHIHLNICASPPHLTVEHVAFSRPTLSTIQHCGSNRPPIELAFSFCGSLLSQRMPEAWRHFTHSLVTHVTKVKFVFACKLPSVFGQGPIAQGST
jgi:hypothetical protein